MSEWIARARRALDGADEPDVDVVAVQKPVRIDRPVAFGLAALVAGVALFAAGIYSFASDDAGGYVCNDLFYRLLHAGAPTLFVHIPEHLDVRRAAAPFARGIARAARAWARA